LKNVSERCGEEYSNRSGQKYDLQDRKTEMAELFDKYSWEIVQARAWLEEYFVDSFARVQRYF